MKVWKWITAGMVGGVISGSCIADILVPDWDGDADTTSVLYSFLTDTNPPVPDTIVNPYGPVVSDLFVVAPQGSGWQDPTDPFMLHRDDGTGAWDVGPNGFITYDVPFADGSLSLYTLELVIDVIAYQNPSVLPSIEVSGTVLEGDLYSFLEEPDVIGSWMHQVWTGTVQVASSSIISIDITGDAVKGSLIDRVSIYTRVIPEPASISLILMASALLLAFKRRVS